MSELSTIEDGILFKFIEAISNKSFDNKTDWGFVVKERNADMSRPRWGKVLTIGPKVSQVSVDDYILIENLQWTNGLNYNDDTIWKTNESKVILVSQEMPRDLV